MSSERTQQTVEDDSSSFVRGAVAGVIAGVVASFVMDRYQAAIVRRSPSDNDQRPATEQAADAVSRILTGHELAEPAKPLGGQMAHYALGTGLGLLYGIGSEYHPRVALGAGTGFGIGVAAVLDDALVPALGLAKAPWKYGVGTHLYSLTSHIVFGLMTEWTRRTVRSTIGQANLSRSL